MCVPSYEIGVLGGGIIGLSLAWELNRRGRKVVVCSREPGQGSASWAAAGMVPPMHRARARDPLDQLQGLSCEIYPAWIEELQRASGVKIEYWPCGGLHVARSTGEAAALQAQVERWHEDGIAVETPRSRHLGRVSPDVRLAYFLPAEAQIRPPRLLNALRTSCERSGVQFVHTTADPRIEHDEQRGYALHLDPGQVRFQQLCITTGAWTAKVAARLGIAIRIEPRRGQMVLFEPCPRALEWIICEGPRYLVPRRDGRILAGSTVEDVGFDSNTVERDIIRLADFARGLVPELRNVPVEAEWAGLRPYTGDGYPFLGGLPHLDHAFVAAGHFRSGIVTAPATARVMSQLILGERPDLDLHAFRLDRE